MIGYDRHECHVRNGRALMKSKIFINLLKFYYKRDSIIISKFSQNIVNLSNKETSPLVIADFYTILHKQSVKCPRAWSIGFTS
jgi:hypothetical protein